MNRYDVNAELTAVLSPEQLLSFWLVDTISVIHACFLAPLFDISFTVCFPDRDTWLGVVQMELKTLTPLLKENRPIAQKVKGLCPRDSASPEPLLALAKALKVGNIAYTYAYMCIHIPLQ